MRFRKKHGKEPSKVTLTEDEIIQACFDYVKKQGLNTGNRCYLKIPNSREELDVLGRKRHNRIEFMVDLK